MYYVYVLYSVLLTALTYLFILHLGTASLTQCVQIGLIGYFSVDGKVKNDHFNFESNDQRRNFITIDKEGDAYYHLVKNFSPPESVILDVTQSKGMSFHV